ncbi:metalloregulator ArsR/SmtB family transcription factor [Paenibacillus sp. FSL M8-0212]|uniref:ArsR/SmtB family transcription factor n=1 Tax=Paenibacillus sp. FSL M8-0212 TaxID=2921618 RepID=UPI0020519B59|nr:metalloregulator ArsR/SmtB family transcription factor [Paenibacillus sp. OVF10]
MRTPTIPMASELKLTTVCNALGDPIRMKIAHCLASSGEKNCSAFEVDHISKSTLSHHIKILREAGVIQPRIEGKQHFYSLRKEELNTRFPGLVDMILNTTEEYVTQAPDKLN